MNGFRTGHRGQVPRSGSPVTRLLAAGRLRLLLAVIAVSVAFGLVIMHQLTASHPAHADMSAVTASMTAGSIGDVVSSEVVAGAAVAPAVVSGVVVSGLVVSGGAGPGQASTAAACGLAAGCVFLLPISFLRPERRARAGQPSFADGRWRSPGASAAMARKSTGRAQVLSRRQLSVCRT